MLIEYGTAAAAYQVLQSIPQHAMFLEGNQRFSVLPANSDILAPAILTPLNRQLICHLVSFSFLIRQSLHFISSCSKGYRPS
ncbi:hypothetical protein, partial [Pseudoflavonifractor sp. SW1122]|uniref:hypothetical protein n=1 Tax=Pseudoflavonifractor sp. SW1122 TaxID=2530044 RepID=UPI00197F17A9